MKYYCLCAECRDDPGAITLLYKIVKSSHSSSEVSSAAFLVLCENIRY